MKLAGWCQPRHLLLSINNKPYEGLKLEPRQVKTEIEILSINNKPYEGLKQKSNERCSVYPILSINNKLYEGLKHGTGIV